QLLPQTLLLGRAERSRVSGSLDACRPRFELEPSRAHPLEVDTLETRLDRRQPLLVRSPARIEDVVERAEALRPSIEIANQKAKVAIVLQRLLKAVRGQQLVQVAALGRVGNRVEPPVPAAPRLLTRVDERLEQC